MVGGGFWGTHYQPAVLHSFGADQAVGQTLYVFRFPPKYHYFETAIVIQVSMKRRNDHVMMLMLKIGELLRQQAGVVVVDQSYGAHHKGVGSNYRRAHQPVANQIAKSF